MTRAACHDPRQARTKLIRQPTTLDEQRISFELRVKTLSDVFAIDSDGIVTVGNESVQSVEETPWLDLVVPSVHDTDLLDRLESDLNARNNIVFHVKPSAQRRYVPTTASCRDSRRTREVAGISSTVKDMPYQVWQRSFLNSLLL